MTVAASYYYYRYNGGEKYFSQNPIALQKKNAASGGKNDKFRFGGKIFGPDRKTHAAKSG